MRRAVADVGAYLVGKRPVFVGVKQFDAVKDEVAALVHGDVRPPFVPAAFTVAGVELGAEEADDDAGFFSHVVWVDMDGFCSYTIGTFLIRESLMNRPALCSVNLPNEITITAMEAARRGEV